MEMIDILDSSGKHLGRQKNRFEIHRDGDHHLAVEIWLQNSKNQLLIQKRSSNKDSHPNLWEISCSGHVDHGETSLQAAVRELQEELGIKVQPADLHFCQRFFEPAVLKHGTYINNEFKDLYLLASDLSIEEFQFPLEEISALRWIDAQELEKLISTNHPEFVPHPVGYPILFQIIHENSPRPTNF